MKLHKVVLGTVAAVALASVTTSVSAGGSLKDEKRPFSWTGFYVGGHVGVLNGNTATVPCGGGTCVNADPEGVLAGVQIGYNYQFKYLVVGVEGDYSFSDASGEKDCANAAFSCRTEVENQASVRGRIGLAWDRALFYGTAGWAWADVSGQTVIKATGQTFADKTNRGGAIYGGGIDVAVSNHVIVGFEYLRADFDTKNHQYDVTYPVKMETDTYRARVNFKF